MARVWSWYSADLKTGRITTRLPLTVTSDVERYISGPGNAGLTLDVTDPTCPTDWESATLEGRTLLAATLTDDEDVTGAEVVVWAGILQRRRIASPERIEFACQTLESYLDARYADGNIGPLADQDQHALMRALIAAANVSGIGLLVDAPNCGIARDDAQYHRYDDKKLSDAITDYTSLDDGPEWVIDVELTAERRFIYTARFRTPRVGSQPAIARWTFTLPGNVAEFEFVRSKAPGDYANVAVAGGEGDGSKRIMSTSGIAQDSSALQTGFPLYESRLATQFKKQSSVDAAAKGELKAKRYGITTVKLTVLSTDFPLNDTWALGDTCRLIFDRMPSMPRGMNDDWRIVGWQINPQADTISPVLTPWPEV